MTIGDLSTTRRLWKRVNALLAASAAVPGCPRVVALCGVQGWRWA